MRSIFLGLLALAACTNGGNSDCTSDCDTTVGTDTDSGDTCDSCGDDTGTPTQTSFVQVEVYVPTEADIVDCRADLMGPPDYSFDTKDENGDPVVMSVEIGTYAVKDGDPANLTSYGTAIHTASDGSLSIAPADASANVGAATEAEPQIVVVDNIPYFRGVYSCNTVVFDYDPDSTDHKSGTGRDLGNFTYSVEVDADGKVDAAENSNFGVLPSYSYFVVTPDNRLEAALEDGISIEASEITPNTFAATIVDTDFLVVADLLCTK